MAIQALAVQELFERKAEMNRQDKLNYYLDIADVALNRSTCLRRKYGAVIVKNDEIISTGYNGAPRGCANCIDVGVCRRQIENIPHGERYELCRSVHAEANAIISAGRKEMIGATLYLAGRDAQNGLSVPNTEPCAMCRRLIINAGIRYVITRTDSGCIRFEDVNNYLEKI